MRVFGNSNFWQASLKIVLLLAFAEAKAVTPGNSPRSTSLSDGARSLELGCQEFPRDFFSSDEVRAALSLADLRLDPVQQQGADVGIAHEVGAEILPSPSPSGGGTLNLTDADWDALPESIQDQFGANVAACCQVLATSSDELMSEVPPVVRYSEDQDPYLTAHLLGRGINPIVGSSHFLVTQGTQLNEGVHYRYLRPSFLGSEGQLKSFRLSIPRTLPLETQTQYFHRIVPSLLFGVNVQSFWFAAQGATSWVFLPTILPSTGISTFAIKLRQPFPWMASSASAASSQADLEKSHSQLAIDVARSELSISYSAQQCADGFEVSGQFLKDLWPSELEALQSQRGLTWAPQEWRRIIEVHHYENFGGSMRKGVFLQKMVLSSTSAIDIARWVLEANQGGLIQNAVATINLSAAGIRSVGQAKILLAALETFYQLTHGDLIRFRAKNKLYLPVNYVASDAVFKNRLMLVGLDFNQGSNALWSASDNKWHIVDF